MGLQHSRHRQEALHQHHHGLAEGSGDAAEAPGPRLVGFGLTKRSGGGGPLCPQSLIPDVRPCLAQEAVVDLHPEEAALSGAEDEEQEHSDQDLQIRRTVTQVGAPASETVFDPLQLPREFSPFPGGCWVSVSEGGTCSQVVHPESQENGQKEAKRSKYEEDDELPADEASKEPEEKMDTSSPGAMETKFPSDGSLQANAGNGSQGKFGLNAAVG